MISRIFSYLKGTHAKLPPSSATRWANKDLNKETLYSMIDSQYAQQIGTLLHEFAEERINFHKKMRKSNKDEVEIHLLKNGIPRRIALNYISRCYENLMVYVNDAIGFRMDSEVELGYSPIPVSELRASGIRPACYGTADAISFRDNTLRIHDLKTGSTPAHMDQLICYAALFCLENKIKPGDIHIELRIYQSEKIVIYEPPVDEILPVIDRIIRYNKWITDYLGEEA